MKLWTFSKKGRGVRGAAKPFIEERCGHWCQNVQTTVEGGGFETILRFQTEEEQ